MKRAILLPFLIFLIMFSFILPVSADDELLYTNFNSDAVKNGPADAAKVPLNAEDQAALITKIRTYHWNDGNGAQPGRICMAEDDQDAQCWPAIGRSDGGKTNIYWEALAEMVLNPGHTYQVSVSDNSGWSYNEASENHGFYELYGIRPIPEGFASDEPENESPKSTAGDEFQTVTFGRFDQDGNAGNGAEEIEWFIVAVQNGMQLVISEYGLDVTPYFGSLADMSWESSKARQWLNDDFYNEAFTEEEKEKILPAANVNPGNETYGVRGGNPTTDLLFLLSLEEAGTYFQSDAERICDLTEHARMKERKSGKNENARWLLRSPGSDASMRAFVETDGAISREGLNCGNNCDQTFLALRPAFWMSAPDLIPETAPAAVTGTAPDTASYASPQSSAGTAPAAVTGTAPDTASYASLQSSAGTAPAAVTGTAPDMAAYASPQSSAGAVSAAVSQTEQQPETTPGLAAVDGTAGIPVVRRQTGAGSAVVTGPGADSAAAIGFGMGFSVAYIGNDCLAQVPEDPQLHMPGETVTVLFEPVEYMNGLIFYGWDINDDGNADFGYAYNTFMMPDQNVTLKAICVTPYYGPTDMSSVLYSYLSNMDPYTIQDLVSRYYSFNNY